MNILRARFKKEIITEFVRPVTDSNKVIILCAGMPGYPGRREDLLSFLADKGYWVFLPRYRGSWESGGSFLKESPHQDVLDIIDELETGFVELWGGNKFIINKPEVYLIGVSFGGPAAILSSRDSRVKKVVAMSPVVDWKIESEAEPFDNLAQFMIDGFGNGYRCDMDDFHKLQKGGFYNPIDEIDSLDASKVKIIHAKDDQVVYFAPTEGFANKLGCEFVALETGGHLSTSLISLPEFWSEIKNFIE